MVSPARGNPSPAPRVESSSERLQPKPTEQLSDATNTTDLTEPVNLRVTRDMVSSGGMSGNLGLCCCCPLVRASQIARVNTLKTSGRDFPSGVRPFSKRVQSCHSEAPQRTA